MREEARPILRKDDALKKLIQRERSRTMPVVPDNVEDIALDGEWAQTSDEHPQLFLIYHNKNNADADQDGHIRIRLFASPESLRLLSRSTTWIMDGNFAMAPT